MNKPASVYKSPEGAIVLVYPYKPPRPTERTWPATKGSIFNMGRKAVELNGLGLNVKNCR